MTVFPRAKLLFLISLSWVAAGVLLPALETRISAAEEVDAAESAVEPAAEEPAAEEPAAEEPAEPTAKLLHKLLTFRGTMKPVKENPELKDKSFRFSVLLTATAPAGEEGANSAGAEPTEAASPTEERPEDSDGEEGDVPPESPTPYSSAEEATAPGLVLHWFLEEQEGGAWAWPDHFGTLVTGRPILNDRSFNAGPTLLYQHGESATGVRLPLPLFHSDHELKDGATWTRSGLLVHVEHEERGQPVWRVSSRGALGLKRTLWVDQASPLVLAANETVFLGQGTEFHVNYELAEARPLSLEEEELFLARFEKLKGFRESLGLEPRVPGRAWSNEQLAGIERELPKLAELRSGPLADLAKRLELEWKEATGKSDALAALKERAQGKRPQPFELAGLDSAKLSSRELEGEVTVLHFWEYRDSPLVEPYGQVGYLDFLYRRHREAGLRVYGVHVDENLANPQERAASITGAGKLQKFMNLGFPVLLDDGSVLAQFGDPRPAGGKLPLFVVIDAEGTVLHYSPGLYKVDRDRGLEKLNFIVTGALEDRAAGRPE